MKYLQWDSYHTFRLLLYLSHYVLFDGCHILLRCVESVKYDVHHHSVDFAILFQDLQSQHLKLLSRNQHTQHFS